MRKLVIAVAIALGASLSMGGAANASQLSEFLNGGHHDSHHVEHHRDHRAKHHYRHHKAKHHDRHCYYKKVYKQHRGHRVIEKVRVCH